MCRYSIIGFLSFNIHTASYLPDISHVCGHVVLGPRVKLLIVPLAGRLQTLDLAPQLPPVAVHVLLQENK